MTQKHYNGETYQMQLDSHHRFVKDWDTKCIKMIHNSDAGEYSVLTTYGPGYEYTNPMDTRSEIFYDTGVNTMSLFDFENDKQPIPSARAITKNANKLSKPVVSYAYSGHFNFSMGKYLIDAGYDTAFTGKSVFNWEEPYQAYLAWKAGYTLYAPNELIFWHSWTRSYRPSYAGDKSKMFTLTKEAEKMNSEYLVFGRQIRRIMFADKEFRRYYDEHFGFDWIGCQGTKKTDYNNLDPYYFILPGIHHS